MIRISGINPKEIYVDETGKVVITNKEVYEKVKAKKASSKELQDDTNFVNCRC
ncbi:hypothetical protein MOB01_18030 [Bacillus spizizenii]|nr:hypothetical protein [Bacillus spizizenii]